MKDDHPQGYPQDFNRYDGRYGVVLVTTRGNVQHIACRSGVIGQKVIDLGGTKTISARRIAAGGLYVPTRIKSETGAEASGQDDNARKAQKRIIVPEWFDAER